LNHILPIVRDRAVSNAGATAEPEVEGEAPLVVPNVDAHQEKQPTSKKAQTKKKKQKKTTHKQPTNGSENSAPP
jgi:hypothetical protein